MRISSLIVAGSMITSILAPACFAEYEKVSDEGGAGNSELAGTSSRGSTTARAGNASNLGGTTARGGTTSSLGSTTGKVIDNNGGASIGGAPQKTCVVGETGIETKACGSCQQGLASRDRRRLSDCTWGAWSEWSECDAPDECIPGETQKSSQACGACGKGTQSRERTCSAAQCTWGAWSAWSTCVEGAACQPGAVNTRSAACSACGGSKTQQQICTDSCVWGAWTDTSSCDLTCCSTLVYCNASRAANPVPGRGTWCRTRTATCSAEDVKNDCYRRFVQLCPSTDSFEPVYYD